MKPSIYSTSTILFLTSVCMLAGCGGVATAVKQATKKEEIDFKPVYQVKLNSRNKAALQTSQPSEELRQKNYIKIGQLSAKYVYKACYDNAECDEKSHSTTPTKGLLAEAGKHGGDLVVLQINNSKKSGPTSKNGRCIRTETRQVPVHKCDYETICSGGSCYTRQTICHTEYVSQTVCANWEKIFGTEYYTYSSGSVWRQDPAMIVQVRYGDQFYEALKSGNVPQVNSIVAKGMRVDIPDLRGRYPLITAVEADQTRIVEYLLQKGANPKIDNSRALEIATHNNNAHIVKGLLKHGADPNSKIGLFKAIKKGSAPKKGQPLINAVYKNNLPMTLALLEHGANVNVQGGAALRAAAAANKVEMMELLIKHRANINKRGFGGTETALMKAVEYAHVDAVKVLLKHKANVKIKSTPKGLGLMVGMFGVKGKTALGIAKTKLASAQDPKRRQAYQQIIELLSAAGAK